MKKDEFIARYRAEMSDVHVSPRLRRAVLDAQNGKEKPVMKKKLSAAVVLVAAISLLAAAAIAAVSRAGILDFAGRYANSFIPEDAQTYVQTDVMATENELVTVHLREMYYDGCISRVAVDVSPIDSSVMLLGFDGLNVPWDNINRMSGEADEVDPRTVFDVYNEGHFQSVYEATASVRVGEETAGASEDYCLNEDGSLTFYLQTEFTISKPQRDATLRISLVPYAQPLTLGSDFLYHERIVLEAPFTMEQTNYSNETYVNTAAAEYPSVGVRVDEIRLEIRAQEIHASIEYTVIDQQAYEALDEGLWFEFIDPENTSEAPALQRLDEGLTAVGMISSLGGDRYRQAESLGRNELHETYTLRAFECWEKERFETRTFTMRKVETVE